MPGSSDQLESGSRRFVSFCRADGRDEHTDTQTDSHCGFSHIYAMHAIQPNSTNRRFELPR